MAATLNDERDLRSLSPHDHKATATRILELTCKAEKLALTVPRASCDLVSGLRVFAVWSSCLSAVFVVWVSDTNSRTHMHTNIRTHTHTLGTSRCLSAGDQYQTVVIGGAQSETTAT